MKKLTAILLLCGLLLSNLAACSNGSEKTQTPADTSVANETTAESVETTQPEVPDDLPELDFEGYVFRVGVAEDEKKLKQVIVEESTGDVVDDAVYEANVAVEERFNTQLSAVTFVDTDSTGALKKSVMAGEDIYDIFTGHDISMGNVSLEGIFRNVNELPYIDYSKPWWPSYSVEALTVKDCMYLIANYISYENISMTRAVFINRDMMENYGFEMPYEDVKNGNWTLDKYIKMCSDIYEDLNGNNERDINDRYGYATNYWLYAIQESFGITPIKENSDGKLEFDINNEKTIRLVEKFHSLLYDTVGGYITVDKDITGAKMFANGQSMFLMTALTEAPETFRDSEVEYGIVPIPKYDETQENYISGSTARPYGVPITAKNDERLGCIIEAMSAYGYKLTRPAFFEVAMKQKFTYDDESAAMLDIISSTVILDFSYVYSNFGGFAWTLMNMIEPGKDSTDFASYYEKNLAAAQKQLDKVQAAYDKLAE